MKKLLYLTAGLLLLAGCQGLRTNTFTDEQAIPLEEGRTDSLTFSVSLDYPVKGASQEVLDRITQGILGAAFDLEEEPGTVEETAARYEDNLKDEYFNEYEEAEGEGVFSWEDRINGYFSGKRGHYVSYMVEYYGFRGGAHGMNTMTPVVFDTRTGATVPEEDFFADGYRAPVSGLIQAHLPEALEGDEEALAALFEPDLVGPDGFYEVSKDGVTWYYQPYDIAPYYLGVISVTVPWAELKPYLREKI
ncbi:MAG: DUF3298 domain-containing protein [Bacteroidales bacterium]|nr:DUF3298 domain-containing protein [Bacteroidales bacterium]